MEERIRFVDHHGQQILLVDVTNCTPAEMIEIGRSSMTVYSHPENEPEQPQRWQKISLMLLESVEPLEFSSPTGSR